MNFISLVNGGRGQDSEKEDGKAFKQRKKSKCIIVEWLFQNQVSTYN